MSLQEKILEDVKVAVKKKDAPRVKALRFLQAAIKNKEIDLRPDSIKEEQVLQVINKQIKQVQESLDYYEKAEGYEEQVKEEQYNLSVLKEYLPTPLSDKEIERVIEASIKEAQPQSIKDMGQVMKIAKEKSKGAVDGKTLSEKIRIQLQNL